MPIRTLNKYYSAAYVPNDDKSRCYKVHTTPMCWKDAYATCHAEQSYLTIINNKKEANFLVELMKKTPEDKNIKTPYHKGHISIGFHDIFNEGEYLTIHGKLQFYNFWLLRVSTRSDCVIITFIYYLNEAQF